MGIPDTLTLILIRACLLVFTRSILHIEFGLFGELIGLLEKLFTDKLVSVVCF